MINEEDILTSLGGTIMPENMISGEAGVSTNSNSSTPVRKWKNADFGDSGEKWDFNTQPALEGIYKGGKLVTTRFGQKMVYEVAGFNGKKYSVWEKAQLKRFFDSVIVGKAVRVEFTGKKMTKNGQTVNSFNFQVEE